MKTLMATIMIAAQAMGMQAQDINLPKPNMEQSSKTVVEALKTRHSVRSFSDKELTMQQISDICWAACGITRDGEHLTSPTGLNKQEIRLMVFTKEGTYEYLAKENKLQQKVEGDNRKQVAGIPGRFQDYVLTAPVSFVMVMDLDKFGMPGDVAKLMTAADAGIVSQNINLYCESAGLATVPRATMDVAGIQQLLGLNENQIPLLNNPVGYEK